MKVLSDMLDRENPLEFSLSGPASSVHGSDHFMNSKRKKIYLMKELQFTTTATSKSEDVQEETFLDDVFGLGETTELCKALSSHLSKQAACPRRERHRSVSSSA